MKTSSAAAKPLSAAAARNCFLMNQFATPGLGSLMGGRILAGLGQLALALAGFGLFMLWFFHTMKQYYNLMSEEAQTPSISFGWYFFGGIAVFALSWLWSLYTSLSLLRQAKVPEPPPPGTIPPRITNTPPKM